MEMGFSNGTSNQSFWEQLKIYFVISGNSYDFFLGFRGLARRETLGNAVEELVFSELCVLSPTAVTETQQISAENDQVISVLCSLYIKKHQIIW